MFVVQYVVCSVNGFLLHEHLVCDVTAHVLCVVHCSVISVVCVLCGCFSVRIVYVVCPVSFACSV